MSNHFLFIQKPNKGIQNNSKTGMFISKKAGLISPAFVYIEISIKLIC